MTASPTAWTFAASSATSSSSLFCPQCHSLLDLPDGNLLLRCLCCHYTVKFESDDPRLEKFAYSTKFTSTSNDSESAEDANDTAASQRAMVAEACGKCGHPEQYWYTRQMRSVDEGQTVFYECPKCNNTVQVDS